MKKYFLYSLLLISCTYACKKKELLNEFDSFSIGSYLKLVQSVKTTLDFGQIANESISLKVKPIGTPLEKINIYAVKGADNLDTTKWKAVKSVTVADTATLTLSVTSQELAAAFGIAATDLKPGDQFTLYNESVTTSGQKFNVINTDDDLEGQPAYQSSFRWSVNIVCPYDPASTDNVVYEVVKDDWEDFFPGDEITVMNGPAANQITLVGVFAAPFEHKDVVITVTPATGTAVVPQVTYGKYSATGASWAAVGTGTVFSCTGVIDLTLKHIRLTDQASASNQKFILKKK